jgi:hypothetical protein
VAIVNADELEFATMHAALFVALIERGWMPNPACRAKAANR